MTRCPNKLLEGTVSPKMTEVYQLVDRVAPSDVSVLLLGPSGTGKEVLAQRLHRLSKRADRPLVAVNCGALNENLLLSELFGHEQGAFTGAVRMKTGLVEEAQGGTLFLDEVGELPMSVQAQLLRFLQSGEFFRVGGQQLQKVDVRVVAATNRNLQQLIEQRQFREDLYFRLATVVIEVPSLKERRDDIEPLVDMFLWDESIGGRSMKSIALDAKESLKNFGWPGNIRQLRNIIERAKIMADKDALTLYDLPEEIRGSPAEEPGWSMPPPTATMDEVERRHIMQALAHYEGNKSKTAASLGITVKTLYNKLERYGRKTTSPTGGQIFRERVPTGTFER